MKRPGGFDRLPDRQEPDEQPIASVSVPSVPVPSVPETDEDPAPDHSRRLSGVLRRFQSEASNDLESASEPVYRAEPDPVAEAERQLREAARRVKSQQKRESRRFSAHTRRRRRNWFIALGTVAALALFVAVGVFTPLMAVRDVQIEGATSVKVEDLQKALSDFRGVPLALVQDSAIRDALEPFPGIERYSMEVIPPSTLKVRIEERVPVLSIEKGGAFQLYDAAGVMLGTAEAPPAGVPLASGPASDKKSKAFAASARVLRDMPAELRAQVVSITASSGQDVTLKLASGVEVMWGDAELSKKKAVVLTSMLGALGDRAVTRIDVSSTEAPVFQ
ncbi:FtsQ-type POTRA domain-containing protein [Leucobacter viscericola]|uniref:FtsQ-type POTRA domain-containing protein n=1 Tax=Leucobacter viscericola TaxID=2714935 RepID=A0A6G7XIP6_9MICO|nr:cell division protein FtsQ/DivIB [Leucobacter viscericola]QIK64445.1 FtsQ-type POTRA domain-containing protein [Leucobacter viscericola]